MRTRAHTHASHVDRLVDCPVLKRSLVALYSTLLPRGGHPWIYLNLELSPEKVDVNVHPTKREVHFLDEEEIIEVVCTQVQDMLANANASRNFHLTQAVLPGPVGAPSQRPKGAQSVAPSSSRSGYPQHMVRTDGKMRTLDAMAAFTQGDTAAMGPPSKLRGHDEGWTATPDSTAAVASAAGRIEESTSSLKSVRELRDEVRKNRHHGLTGILDDFTLVGVVDSAKSLSLIQHGTRLYLVQYGDLLKEVSYQMVLRQFGTLPRIRLSPAPALADVIQSALVLEQSSQAERLAMGLGEDSIVIERACNRLLPHAAMLSEYFSLDLDEATGLLVALPNLVGSGNPLSSSSTVSSSSGPPLLFNLDRLPTLMLRLATQVDWKEEKQCLHGVMREIALAHLPSPAIRLTDEAATKVRIERDWQASWTRLIRLFVPSLAMAEKGVVAEVASLPSLYSVFERC